MKGSLAWVRAAVATIGALALLDACVRLLPGVMGHTASGSEESHESGLLEYPQYTRPREFRGMPVPDILLSGDHAAVARWRAEQSELRSRPPQRKVEP